MKKVLFILFLSLTVFTAAVQAKDAPYHPARTEAEKALDRLLIAESKENILFVLDKNTPLYNSALYSKYAPLFTSALLKSVFKAEAAQVKKNCHGEYNDGDCGFDFSILSCTQGVDPPFIYQTKTQTHQEAVINYTWPPNSKPRATYYFIKKRNTWKLDGIDCLDGFRFHVK